MSRRLLLTIVTGCLLAGVLLWMFLPVGVVNNDEARYREWKHTARSFGRVMWWENRLPASVVRLLGLPALEKKYLDQHETLGEALIVSGYLTSVPVMVNAAPTNSIQRVQVAIQLRKVLGPDTWEFYERSNAVVITCRPVDVPLCRKALQE